MFTHEIQQLAVVFEELVKRRRGKLVRRGGALSSDFEAVFEHQGFECLVGVEHGGLRDDSVFVFVRHSTPDGSARPQRPAVVSARRPGMTMSPSASQAPDEIDEAEIEAMPDPPPPIHGFSVRLHPPDILERLVYILRPHRVYTDKRRPGWFHVEAPPGFGGERLPADISAPLSALSRQAPLDYLSIAMTSQIFRIRREPVLFDAESMNTFLTRALELFLAARTVPPPAPTDLPESTLFWISAAFDVAAASRCGVCGEEAKQRRVQCARCDTPHHQECWNYGGGCSVYGCGCADFLE